VSDRPPVVRLTELSIEREGTSIVSDVSWRVEAGQHWAMLGANGSGKTSVLSAIMGYLPATRGHIEVLGERYGRSDWRLMRRRIGIVSSALSPLLAPSEPALLTVLSGKTAMLGHWGTRSAADLSEAREILQRVECLHVEQRPWSVLSQGERQRVLIGRALMAAPPLLILDEPCAGLDPAARERILQFLTRWARSPLAPTLVLVTHHVEEIIAPISHAVVLERGRVLASGPKGEVMSAEVLSRAFHAKVRISCRAERYLLEVEDEGETPA
jgi:iron complex transport system ATP-binding protein